MGDRPTDAEEPNAKKKRGAARQITQDDDHDAEDEGVGEDPGTFQQASEEVLAKRRILKAKRPPPRTDPTPTAPSSNPFAGVSLVAPSAPSPAATPAEPSAAEETPKEPTEKATEEAKSTGDAEKSAAADSKADEKGDEKGDEKAASTTPTPSPLATPVGGSVPSTFSGLFGQKDSSASVPAATTAKFGILGGSAPAFSFRPASSAMWSG
eukprot:CAMPEP_0118934160 /NCGR_PEP_ID=MMETSP1169-20130426/13671_1 /TAXON_ID=36882 /ORGANISM="Pyramimonas obovata, Strain CCMP722" /LENGTH=209 /DNA_ID=CAMNT_0006877031 /DNA_START=240 /DNA_END=866 /DNA_ORIENTATION=+